MIEGYHHLRRMGVLNFNLPSARKSLRNLSTTAEYLPPDISILVDSLGDERVSVREPSAVATNSRGRGKRKRTKSGGSSGSSFYDFRDYGIDQRRKGSRHQRRKQNLLDIGLVDGIMDGTVDGLVDDVFEDGQFVEHHNTPFAELFQDAEKMKAWDEFAGLSDEAQAEITTKETKEVAHRTIKRSNSNGVCDKYLTIDKKIRAILKNNKPAVTNLLVYYEGLLTCFNPPACLLLDVESGYDRMIVYAICQYTDLMSTTVKLKTSTLIEIDVGVGWEAPGQLLSDYLNGQR